MFFFMFFHVQFGPIYIPFITFQAVFEIEKYMKNKKL